MDTNKMPAETMAQFDEAFRAKFGCGVAEVLAAQDEDSMAMMGAAMWAWEASRAAVVVELPEAGKPAPEDDKRWHSVRNSTIGACRRAIEAQGLKVAP